MIAIRIKAGRIDYEKTFERLFPVIQEKLDNTESQNMLIRLFQKLDDAALPLLLRIMSSLSESTRNELLVQCLNAYSARLKDMLNRELEKHPYGKYLKVGRVSGVWEKESVCLWFGQVQADYKSLVKEKLGGMLGGLASFLVNDKIEKTALELLWTEESRRKLTKLAQNTLDQYGFVMELSDIQMTLDAEEAAEVIAPEGYLKRSDKLEEDILNALAEFLRRYI